MDQFYGSEIWRCSSVVNPITPTMLESKPCHLHIVSCISLHSGCLIVPRKQSASIFNTAYSYIVTQ